MEGQFVEDIVLDTGCSRTLVRGDLVSKENLILGRAITVQCAHGDVVMYPVASVEIEIQGNTFTVEAGVSDRLPQSVLLGTDVPGLKELLKGREKAHMVVTRGQACRLKQSQPEQDKGENVRASPVSGDVASSVDEEGVRPLDSNSQVHEPPVLDQQESRFEDCVPPETVGMNLPGEGNDCLLGEFCFDEDVFVGGKGRKGSNKSRSEKKKDCLNYARVQKTPIGDLKWGISKQELRKLQDEDSSIQTLRKTRPDRVVEQDGLWYHLWTPRQQLEKTVKQLLLPKSYRKIVCKLAHAVPLAGHLGRDKTADRITRRFYWLMLFCDVADYCHKYPEGQ